MSFKHWIMKQEGREPKKLNVDIPAKSIHPDDIVRCQEFIRGSSYSVASIFYWRLSAQGVDFWDRQQRLTSSLPISERFNALDREAQDYIRAIAELLPTDEAVYEEEF